MTAFYNSRHFGQIIRLYEKDRCRLLSDIPSILIRKSKWCKLVMTEYEALELVDGVFGSLWTVSQFGFGVISAYCLLAYYIGAKLSFFQVAFVNICFFVMNAVANLSLLNAFRRLEYIADNLSDVAIQAMPVTVIPVGAVLTFDAFLVIGCYAFMWSVRHSKD